MAIRIIIVAVVEVIFVRQLFASGNITNGPDPNLSVNLFGFAIWIAGMIEKHSCPESIDHFVLPDAEQVSYEPVLISFIRYIFGKTWAVIFHDESSLFDWSRGVATGRMDRRGADNKTFEHLERTITNAGLQASKVLDE